MRAASFVPGCDATELSVGDVPLPILRKGQLLLRVKATAVNRADILQRKGNYPPPAGESEILGLEAAGIVSELDGSCSEESPKVGDRVMALLPGGGNAQVVAVNAEHVMRVPDSLSWSDAAAIPEVWLTSYQLLNRIAGMSVGEKVLIHAGASGVGTAAIQLVTRVFHGTAFATAGSEKKCQLARDLGAHHVINYKEKDFADEIQTITQGLGVDIVLDCVGGMYWEKNVRSLSVGGRWVLYGLLGGGDVNGNILAQILRKRIRLEATTLRARSQEYKSALIKDFTKDVIPLLESGELKAVVDSVLPFEMISQAHQRLEDNANLGKVVLALQAD